MKIYLIAALGKNGAIGKDNDLIWNLPDDMRFFKETTQGATVLMGRKNFESIPHKYRPLPGRENIVLTRNEEYEAAGCILASSLKEGVRKSSGDRKLFIIGGAQIYQEALDKNIIDTMYLTEIDEAFEADAFFPKYDKNDWEAHLISSHPRDNKHAYPFRIIRYERKI